MAAIRLGVSQTQIYRMMQDGRLRYVGRKGERRIPESAIVDFEDHRDQAGRREAAIQAAADRIIAQLIDEGVIEPEPDYQTLALVADAVRTATPC
jgi:excisionase family DNA binding protein